MFADAPSLLRTLAQQALGDHVGHVLAGDAYLLEAVLDPPHRVGHELEAWAVKERFLDPGHKAKARQAAGFAQLSEEGQVQHQRLITPRAQIVEQLVHDEQEPLVWVPFLKGAHHADQQVLAVGCLIHRRKRIGDAHLAQCEFHLAQQDVAQAHRRRADLGAHHEELPGNRSGGVGHLRVRQRCSQIGVLGHRRQHRHQVRLACPIVAHDQQAHVVLGLGELQLRDHQPRQDVGHALRDDIGLDQGRRFTLVVGLPKLDDSLDGIKLDQVSVLHLSSYGNASIAASGRS